MLLIRKCVAAAFFSIIAASCGGTATEQVIGPGEVRCQISVTQVPPLPPGASTVTANVTAARDCTWTASTEAAWVDVSPASGQGTAPVTVVVAANPETRPRSAALIINDIPVTISQDGLPCRFELSAHESRAGHEGGRASVRVSTSEACEWRASSSAHWVRVVTDQGSGAGTVDLEVSRNDGPERSTTLTIAGLQFVVSQEGFSTSPPSPPSAPLPPVCTFAIDPERRVFESPGGVGSVRVITEPGCQWTAATQTPWMSISRSGGTGPDTLQYFVAVYTARDVDREGSITVAGRTHSVRQALFRPEEVAREGVLASVSGSCPNFSFTVGGRVFVTDARTRFDAGCDKVRNGVRAFVRGELLPDGRVLATQVDIDD